MFNDFISNSVFVCSIYIIYLTLKIFIPPFFQCGEFKYPDVSSPLYKILGEARRNGRSPLYELSPRKKVLPTDSSGDFTSSSSAPVRGSSSLSISPYNPNFDEVFLMSTRTPEASPYRHHQNHYRYVDPTTGQSHSPESDVGYGTSFGSQDFNGHHNIDIDSISNLLVIYHM